MARSLQDIITSMIGTITGAIPGISTKNGTVVKDVVINAPATEFTNVYVENDNIAQLLTLQNYDSFTTQELDDMASDYGLTRLEGRQSKGVVVFRFKTLVDVSIPYNTQVSTPANSPTPNISFIVSATVQVLAANLSAYYNYTTSFYEVSANVESVNIGLVNNVAAGTITKPITTITNLDSIYNYLATSDGTDQEVNFSLANRIKLKMLGNNVGTNTGYDSTIANDNRVIDSIIVGPNDIEMVRNEFGGSIDAYILGEDLAEVTETYNYSLGMTQIVLAHKPVHIVSLVTAGSIGPGTPLTSPTDYTVTPDIGLYKKSSASVDTITLTSTGIGLLTPPDTLIITYSYNKLIEDLQADIDQDASHIVTADVLIREAEEILVNITANVSIFSGYNKTSIKSDIETAISTQLAAYLLNQDLHPSDIIGWIESVEGVDKVDLATLVPSTDVAANKTQYLRPGTLTINIA